MDRRRFILDSLTLLGTAGICGMLLDGPREGSSSPSPAVMGGGERTARPPSHRPWEEAEARGKLAQLEKAGLAPRDAMYWEKTPSGLIRCTLCPKYCELRPFERGNCRVRISLENRLGTLVYGKPCSVAIDPIEKKPVFHLLPGSTAFSIATAGCLLGCRYCQNWQISQANPEDVECRDFPPEAVVAAARAEGCRSIAYTYTEPTVFYEYMFDTATLAKKEGIHNVVVSCGYINPEPLAQLAPLLTVMKVDLKGFTERFYQSICGGTLAPVLATLSNLAKSKVLIDIVTLVVPTLNDDLETNTRMFTWIRDTLGPHASLFLSRFYPTYRLRNLPPTPPELMVQLREKAMEIGLKYVYLGNVPGSEGENTYCHSCGKLVVGRIGYQVTETHIEKGACGYCKTVIPGVWTD